MILGEEGRREREGGGREREKGEKGRRGRKGGGGGREEGEEGRWGRKEGGGGKLNAFIPGGIINESHPPAKISRTTYVTLMEFKYPEFYTYTVLMHY